MSEVIKVSNYPGGPLAVCGLIEVSLSPSGMLIELSEGNDLPRPVIQINIHAWPLVVAAVERELARRQAEAVLHNEALTLDLNYDPDA